MRKITLIPLTFLAILIIIFSCRKLTLTPAIENRGNKENIATAIAPPPSNTPSYIDSMDVNHDNDSIERMTVLGKQLTNPYLIPNMLQAYANLGITNVAVTVTHKYVRFKPTIDQLSALDSTMDEQGLELFDAPLDYQILLEGDYYQDPNIPDEQPTWQYAVVPANFSFPTGVQYETLASIHIPSDDYTAVETEAERLAGSQGGGGGITVANSTNGGAVPMGIICAAGYHKDPETGQCVPNNCPTGYHWDDSKGQCVPDNSSCPTGYHWNGTSCVVNSTSPPPPAPDAAIPSGNITVDETQQLAGLVRNTSTNYYKAPVRNARVVARRWFKIERTYTDNNGNFRFAKRFKHKVRINIKFKNDDAIVRCMRGARLWQMLFPLKKTLGVFSGDKSNITYNFNKYDNSVHAKGNRYWAGGTVHNAVQEYKDFATAEGIGQPQGKLRILVTDFLTEYGDGSTPMFNKRWISSLPNNFITLFIASNINLVAGGVTALTQVLQHEVDMTISYIAPNSNYSSLYSDDLKETAYHELTHAGHYAKLGSGWYTSFANAELSAIADNIGNGKSPYGNGTASYSPIIAVGESWASHIGQYFADRRYGSNSTTSGEQLTKYPNYYLGLGLSCHLAALEFYDPNLPNYIFDWIPKGLYYDLMDVRVENMPPVGSGPVNDNVSGYTNQQLFNAFNSTILSIQSYRTNFIQQNNINPSTAVTTLFQSYGY